MWKVLPYFTIFAFLVPPTTRSLSYQRSIPLCLSYTWKFQMLWEFSYNIIVFISHFSVAQFHLEKYKDALASFQTGSQLDKADANFSQWIEKCKVKIPGPLVKFVGYMIVKFKSLAKEVILQTLTTASLKHLFWNHLSFQAKWFS